MSEAEESEIISGCQAGSSESYQELMRVFGPVVYGYFRRLTGSGAESDDLFGELFLRIVENMASFRGGSLKAWIFTIASNLYRDHLRGLQRRRKLLEQYSMRLRAARDRAADSSEPLRSQKLQKSLRMLDEDTRELVVLRYYSGLSFRELASARGEPIGTTLSKVHRGLKRLRELME